MHTVTIYSTPTCGYCKLAKQFFKDHGVAYTEKDVAGDAIARAEMIQKSGQMAVPVIEIDATMILGFDEKALQTALDIKS